MGRGRARGTFSGEPEPSNPSFSLHLHMKLYFINCLRLYECKKHFFGFGFGFLMSALSSHDSQWLIENVPWMFVAGAARLVG